MSSRLHQLLATGLWLAACASGAGRDHPVARKSVGVPQAAPSRPLTMLAVPGGWLAFDVCAPDAIRVAFAKDAKFFERPTLATAPKRCVAAHFELERSPSEATLRTARLELRVELATGRVAFYDREGSLLAAEKPRGRTLTPATVQGESTNHVRQEWQPNDGEALYGLGNHQLGFVNLRGYDLDLAQYNTNAIVPLLVSSRGYGILWDNASYTRFGDIRAWERVPGFAHDADGNLSTRTRENGDVTVDVQPPVTGDYLFRTFSCGDIRLSIAGKDVVQRFRQGWLPEADVARVRLEAGVSVPVRVQWTADIGVKRLELEWKTPPAAPPSTSLWSEVGDGTDYWFFYGPELDHVISGYRRVTGEAKLLPKWAFGLFQSRERYKTAAELTQAVAGFRSRNVPLDVIVQDWRYWVDGQWGSHEFDRERFPEPAAWIRELHEKYHTKFVISVWPKFYTNTANYAALRSAGFTYAEPSKPRVDFLRQPFIYYDAFAAGGRRLFWQQIREKLFGFGVDGWWLDATEPEVVEGPYESHEHGRALHAEAMHPTALGSGSRMLNAYSLAASQAIYEGQRSASPAQRVFVLTRSAFAGQQRYASVTWSGDITSTWTAFKKQIPGGLGFSISGIPYWTVDSGGFSVPPRFSRGQNAEEWAELNARWFEYATFLPLTRLHGQAPAREPWEFGGDASPAYRAIVKFARLRYRLLPYVYSVAGHVTHHDGTMLRPLVMDFRTDPAALDIFDQFLFGPAFLVSPVTDYRATERSVYLPATPGGWYDFWTGNATPGGRRVTVPAPLDAMPVHVRAGSIVPFGPELAYTSEKLADPLVVFVYAGSDGEFELYEDDGASYGYENGGSSTIPLHWNDATRTLTLGTRRGSFPGMLVERTVHVVRVATDKAVGFSFTPKPDATVTFAGSETHVAVP